MRQATGRPTGWGDPPVVAPTLDSVRRASERLKDVARRTPLVPFGPREDGILLKSEVEQPSGSFKIRGVYNWAAGLAPDTVRRGFSTFSAGNTALALAHCAGGLGTTCRSLLPDSAPERKVQALRDRGVETVLVAFEEMADYIFSAGWRDEPYAFLHPWTEPAMISGHATMGLEIVEDLPDVETVFVPVGGGALAAGVGCAVGMLDPAVRIIGVQTESYPSLAQSFHAGRPVWIESRPTICDGVAVPFVTEHLYPLLRETLDSVLVVSEEQVRKAIRLLARTGGVVAEGAGALALAAALDMPLADRGLSVCLVTGGNIPEALLEEIVGVQHS
ncbi:pyridoxal-phosphate dependent enzyme [candidate division WOR-3 bacterium]|uniref:Pyridoxal-phosphate dependent enzyme n=1 Tax=candidate division WOR-3 bacterium TaxID=2052148 RepID=A0A938BQ68_UNCW3|nr:pyridoxal-phosphate dependent enzyme [candidate division WOR-3 bacterium]